MSKTVNVAMPEALQAQVRAAALADRRSVSQTVCLILEAHFKKGEKP